MQHADDHPLNRSIVVEPGNVHRLVPDLAHASAEYYAFLISLVDPVLVELCRLRIAQIVGSSEHLGTQEVTGIDAGQLEDLAEWRDSARFDAAQQACLEFAEYFCYSSQSVTDEHVARLTPHLSYQQILGLTCALWISDAFHRMSNFLELIGGQETPASK
jgi:alkylhydroperoxidase family enzyme